MLHAPVTVLQANTKRDTGKKAQLGNIMAAKVGDGSLIAYQKRKEAKGLYHLFFHHHSPDPFKSRSIDPSHAGCR
jgi:hypothetical protein